MNTDQLNDAKIVESWGRNAESWTVAVRAGHIESRRQVTDHAILGAILDCSPLSVLDLGCGEGWLVRELAGRGIAATGVDAVPAFIEAARDAAGGDFRVISYSDIAAGKLRVSVDAVVCNFSLFGKDSVEGLFRVVPGLLNVNGAFIVQTLHPDTACGNLPCRDGWRKGSWDGIGAGFTDPAPWYFRTLVSWRDLFAGNGFRLHEVHEPLHPQTRKPVSIVFIGETSC
jgi:2-polyprenyl-3-methyl-5-hydroxy-6-metoxy-1,4-benzoquinol methylase